MATRKVIVAFTIDGSPGRDCLSGVFDFVNTGHDWNIQFVQDPNELTPLFVRKAVRDGVSGIITGFRERTDGLMELESAPLPVVFTDYPKNETPKPGCNNYLIRNDDIAIGREGARHLLARGTFQSFAFIPTQTRSRWSTLRERGFRLQLGESGIVPRKFQPGHELATFLAELPKPAAIMSATDYCAVQVIEACRTAKMSVPDQIAVVSVDNDELLCNTSRPTISSIQPDHEGLGRIGAEILDRMMSGRKPPRNTPTLVKSRGVIERDSTRVVPPAGYVLREALAYIRSDATKGIGVDDVVRHVGVSRRLLYLRFRQMHGKSIHETILDTRLAAAKRKLSETNLPLARIAADCGFGSANRLSHAFFEKFSTYPTAFRGRR